MYSDFYAAQKSKQTKPKKKSLFSFKLSQLSPFFSAAKKPTAPVSSPSDCFPAG